MAELLLARLFGNQPQLPSASEEAGFEAQETWDDEQGEQDEAAGDGGGSGEDADPSAGIDMDASAADVVRRIRCATLWFVSQLSEGKLPEIELVSNAAGNRVLQAGDGEGGGDEQLFVLRLQQQTATRSLLGRHPESAEQVARLWVLLGMVHSLLLVGEQATQRELWYQVKPLEIFRSLRDVAEAVQDAVALLGVPRSALGITASSKGLVAGRLLIRDQHTGTATDCAASGGGVPIPGDVARICRDWAYETDAQLVLVVEKDAVFQRLVQQRLFDAAPAIIVTGKGVPDLATRAFLSCLSSNFPDLPLVGLVDWNPAGVSILTLYRFGGGRMGLESPQYALPSLGWLGARSSQLQLADAGAFQELTSRDRSQGANLAAALEEACPEWAAELRSMLASGSKAEIEALDSAAGPGGLPDMLLRCLEEGDCI